MINGRQLKSPTSCSIAAIWFTSLEAPHHDAKTDKADDSTWMASSEKTTFRRATCFDILRTTGVSGLSESLWQPTKKKNNKKKLTSQTEERIGFDRSQPPFIGTYWRGKQRVEEEDNGKGVASKWATVLEKRQTVWKHTSTCMDTHETWYHKPRHITRLVRGTKGGVFVCEGRMKHPSLGIACAPWYHLFVILNWQRAQEARVLHKPYPVWLCAGELIPPKTLIVILSWCWGICRAPTAKPTAGLSGRWGCCVYMCALSGDWANRTHRIIDGTQLPKLVLFLIFF